MKLFIDFLRENWKFVLTLVLCLLEIVFIFVKRKPKSIDDFKLCLNEVLATVPELVISRERPGEGELKKSEVEVSAKKLLERRLGRGLTVNECLLVKEAVDNKIETVLSTPTKKEKINEK